MAMSGSFNAAVMRNPLADPGIIGVTSGSAFAAVIVSSLFPSFAALTPIFSFAGGIIAFAAFIFLLGARKSARQTDFDRYRN